MGLCSLLFDLRPNYGGGNEDNGNLLQRFHAGIATLNAPDPAAGQHQPTPPLETHGRSQASLGQSLVGFLLLSPGSWWAQQISQSGDLPKGLRIPWEFEFGGQGDLITELTQDSGDRLGGHKRNLVCTRTQKKGAVTPQETDPDLPVSVQESPAETWVGSGLLQCLGH